MSVGVERHAARLFENRFRPRQLPASRNVAVVVNTPDSDVNAGRFFYVGAAGLSRDDPSLLGINLNLKNAHDLRSGPPITRSGLALPSAVRSKIKIFPFT